MPDAIGTVAAPMMLMIAYPVAAPRGPVSRTEPAPLPRPAPAPIEMDIDHPEEGDRWDGLS